MVKQSTTPPRRLPQTTRGKSTRAQLLKGAEKAFYKHGYPKTSVAEICRAANVANGTFYQYFSDKSDVFAEIVHELSDYLLKQLKQVVSRISLPTEQMIQINHAFFQTVAKKISAYQIFRESEFVDLKLAQSFYAPLVDLYACILQDGAEREQLNSLSPEATAWGVLGLQEFVATRWMVWEKASSQHGVGQHDLREIVRSTEAFLLNGLGCSYQPLSKTQVQREADQAAEAQPPSTRKALLSAAERLFGVHGFYATSISEITREVGVAQGTFYLYFPSKVAIFAQLVREINRNLIAEIRHAAAGLTHRREIEQAGFLAFFRFIRRHRLAYRIVREAEFVDEEAGQGYYRRIAAGYVKGLSEAMDQGQILNYKTEPLSYCLMGVGHLAGLKWLVWEDLEKLPQDAFSELMRFVCEGVLGGYRCKSKRVPPSKVAN